MLKHKSGLKRNAPLGSNILSLGSQMVLVLIEFPAPSNSPDTPEYSAHGPRSF